MLLLLSLIIVIIILFYLFFVSFSSFTQKPLHCRVLWHYRLTPLPDHPTHFTSLPIFLLLTLISRERLKLSHRFDHKSHSSSLSLSLLLLYREIWSLSSLRIKEATENDWKGGWSGKKSNVSTKKAKKRWRNWESRRGRHRRRWWCLKLSLIFFPPYAARWEGD